MNRTERRRLASKGFSDRDIRAIELEKAYQRGVKDGKLDAIEIMFYMTAYTLNYKLDFGAKRLQRVMYWIFNNIDSFRTGHLTREDYPDIKKKMNKLGVILDGGK